MDMDIKKMLVVVAIIFFGFAPPAWANNDNTEREALAKEIIEMVKDNSCSDNSECRILGFGSFPCGGYERYLAYSSNINEKELKNKADKYYKLDKEYDAKLGAISICMLMPKPTPVCVNNICVGLKNIQNK